MHGLHHPETAVFRLSVIIFLVSLSLFGASAPALFHCVASPLCIMARCISAPGFGACLMFHFEIRSESLFALVLLAVYFGKYREGCMVVIAVGSASSMVQSTASWYLTLT